MNSIINETLKNGIHIELYTSVYGSHYVITAFSPDYKVLKSRKTQDYNYALHIFTILKNQFSPEEFQQETKPAFTAEEVEKALQWVADVYHCSEIWGTRQTEEEMLTELQESQKQKNPGDYSPDPALFRECAAYWNKLAEMYPN